MSNPPCIVTRDLVRYQGQLDKQSAYDLAIEKKAEELRAEYRQDLQVILDMIGDLSANHCVSQLRALLTLIRDGSDDAELGRLVRDLVMKHVDEFALLRAEEAVLDDLDADDRIRAEDAFERKWGNLT